MGSQASRRSAPSGAGGFEPASAARLRLVWRNAIVLGAVVLIGLVMTSSAVANGGAVRVVGLEVDGRSDNPLGVDDQSPTLSWRVKTSRNGWKQTAYQIRVARSERDLERGRYLWSSGKVASRQQANVAYEGPSLESRATVAWQVRVWGKDDRSRGHGRRSDNPSRWSRVSTWEMGLLERGDWGAAKWIEYPGRALSDPLPIFARAFELGRRPSEKVAKARLYLSGVGLHEAQLNGARSPTRSSPRATPTTSSRPSTGRTTSRGTCGGREHLGCRARATGPPRCAARSRTRRRDARRRTRGGRASSRAAARSPRRPLPGATNVKVSSVAELPRGRHDQHRHRGRRRPPRVAHRSRRSAPRAQTARASPSSPALSAAHAAGALVTGSGNNLGDDRSERGRGGHAADDRPARDHEGRRVASRRSSAIARGGQRSVRRCTTCGTPARTTTRAASSRAGRRPGRTSTESAKRRDGSPVGWVRAGIAPPPNLDHGARLRASPSR